MTDETVQTKFIRWTRERPKFALSEFQAGKNDSLEQERVLEAILPLLSDCGCEIIKGEGDLIIQWRRHPPCIPADAPSGRKVDPEIQTAIEAFIRTKTGKSWKDPLTLDRIREAIIGQKETYWKEGDDRVIRYKTAYSIFAYLAYQFPTYFIQMRHLIRELMKDGLLPERMAVLDVGCGPGTVTLALHSLLSEMPGCQATIHTIEQAPEFVEAYRLIAEPVAGKSSACTILPPHTLDITDPNSPLPEGPYDMIVCANVLNEIRDQTVREETVMRLSKHLREDGTILICEPADLTNATELRILSRRLKERGLPIYAPCNDIRGVPCTVERCWSFVALPEVSPTRLMNAVAETDEPYRFHNTDIKASYAIHRRDSRKKIGYRVPSGAKAERISRLPLHEGKKITIIASKISGNIGDSGTFLYRICDGTGKLEAYAALPAYHQSEKNTALRSSAYGSVLRLERVLVRHHKKYNAFHLLLTKESTAELLAGGFEEGDTVRVREARQETKRALHRRSTEGQKSKVGKQKKK